jgi:hypothetical protein
MLNHGLVWLQRGYFDLENGGQDLLILQSSELVAQFILESDELVGHLLLEILR